MILRWIIPIVVLPGTVLIGVPALLVFLTRNSGAAAELARTDTPTFWLAVLMAIPGSILSLSAMALFFRFGEGTPAPWDPPRKLVVQGVYRWVRNPMLSGVIVMLSALSLLLQSWVIATWAGVFFLANTIYFRFSEEPGLRQRFGDDYQRYCKHVPRWVPRLRPWDPHFE